ncbi:acyl-coenzyme A synthetase ACSM5, mitochondrial isoform X4 [Macaca fascicularis]|uniref:acyl-coenzyme A synthetase ACSM5, mitochondrial isoform X4 n=1 Tax=Macaca fascicularis TaxID=9541 RepID=UPI003D15CDFB
MPLPPDQAAGVRQRQSARLVELQGTPPGGTYRAQLPEDKESRPAGHLLHQRNHRGPQDGRALPEQLRTGFCGQRKTLSTFPITTLCCVPTIFRLLVQEDLTRYQFQSLRHCLTGGEALNPGVREKWKRQTGVELYEGYGQSETVVICANPKGMKIKSGSMGKAVPPYDVQIVDDEGNVLPPGEEGNVAIRIRPTRPFCFFNCYLDNPEKTAASEQGDFYITGDRARMDKDGYFWFMGRNDDVINSSSYRIGPVEVESALAEHPAVLESAVVSSPDPIRGEVVKAFIVLTPDYSSHDPEALTRELQEHVKRVTAPYKYPRKVAFVSELPKTVSGKIQRSKLRSQEWRK